MGDPGVLLVIGLLGVLLALVSTVALVLFAAVGGHADRRDDALRERGACGCEPEAELTLGVEYHPAGAERPTRALIDAQRTDVDEVGVFLQPVDGSRLRRAAGPCTQPGGPPCLKITAATARGCPAGSWGRRRGRPSSSWRGTLPRGPATGPRRSRTCGRSLSSVGGGTAMAELSRQGAAFFAVPVSRGSFHASADGRRALCGVDLRSRSFVVYDNDCDAFARGRRSGMDCARCADALDALDG